MIGSFYTMSHGLNLQKSCHWVVFLDPPPSQQHGAQCAGRVYRLGQEETVELVTLNVENTFSDRQIRNNLRKATPGALASLNSTIFGGDLLSSEMPQVYTRWIQIASRLLKYALSMTTTRTRREGRVGHFQCQRYLQ